jgi:thiol:disulfide interchange protein DsbA
MNRILACALLALGLAACGNRENASPVAEKATPTAEKPAAVAATAEPAAAEPAAAAQGPASDGESVDESPASSISPIADAVAENTPAPAATLPSKWKEGQNFSPLPAAQPVSVGPGEVEVVEIFWYGCGHCFALEPRLEAWEKSKPSYLKLVRMPVVWNEVAREDARLFYTLEALGRLGDLHLAVFRELHVNRNPLTVVTGNRVDTGATEKKVRDFLLSHGVSQEDFGRTYRSFAIESKIRQAENLSRRYMADHTPMAVVQGKYMTDVGMAGGLDQFFELIDDLAARERAEH